MGDPAGRAIYAWPSVWESIHNVPGKENDNMFKWRSMQALQDRNETLFYRILLDHIEVGRCRLTGSKPVLKAPMVSATEAEI